MGHFKDIGSAQDQFHFDADPNPGYKHLKWNILKHFLLFSFFNLVKLGEVRDLEMKYFKTLSSIFN